MSVIEYSTKFQLAPIDLVKKYDVLMRHYKVSKTSLGGFLEVFYEQNGSEQALCDIEYKKGKSWMMKREKFLSVFMSKCSGKKMPLKIGLAVIAWAYMPSESLFDYDEADKQVEHLKRMNKLVERNH